jgi:hypothetical protein
MFFINYRMGQAPEEHSAISSISVSLIVREDIGFTLDEADK